MVSQLNKKLWRDLLGMKAQVVTIALVVGAGIAVFIGGLTTYDSLDTAQSNHYRQHQFADVFVYGKRIPGKAIRDIEAIDNVNQVESRLVYDVTLEVSDMKEPATGRFISTPEFSLPDINQLSLRQGRFFSEGSHRKEVLVNESFAKAHQLKPGDTITAILNGKREYLTLVGIVLSPEFVYAIREQDLLPDNRHFGIFWIPCDTLAASYEMEGAFNSLVLTTAKGASKKAVIDKVDAILKPFGGTGSFANDALLSNRFVSNELRQLQFLSIIIPFIFISTAAFLLGIVSGRLITIQRQQIATLKAVGYNNRVIGWYYLKLISAIVFLGTLVGLILGLWMGQTMTNLYRLYFHFPRYDYVLKARVPFWAILISAIAAFAGTLTSLRRIVSLPPAEAMRPPMPPSYSHSFFDKLPGVNRLNAGNKMILRYLSRQPLRSLITIIGLGLAIAIIILGYFWSDSVSYLINTQFYRADREDAVIAFKDLADKRVLRELQRVPGVLAAEGFRSVPVRIKNSHYSYDTGLMGLEEESQMKQLFDAGMRPIAIHSETLLFSQELADRLHVSIGDEVIIEVLQGKRPIFSRRLSGLVNDYVGINAYMALDNLNRILDEGQVLSGANLLIDKASVEPLTLGLKTFPQIATMRMKSTLIAVFNETFSRQVLVFTSFFAGFAILLAIGIVFNTARIALAERSWELASLRVLGFTYMEVFRLVMGGIIIELCIGIPLGILMGFGLSSLSTYLMPTEFVRLPLFIKPNTYGISIVVIMGTTAVTSLIIYNRIKRLNLIAVLKSFD